MLYSARRVSASNSLEIIIYKHFLDNAIRYSLNRQLHWFFHYIIMTSHRVIRATVRQICFGSRQKYLELVLLSQEVSVYIFITFSIDIITAKAVLSHYALFENVVCCVISLVKKEQLYCSIRLPFGYF